MNTNNTEIHKAAFTAGQCAQDAFRHRYRECLASFDSAEVAEALVAHIRLELLEEIAGKTPDFEHYLALLERAFLTLYDRKILAAIAAVAKKIYQRRMRRSNPNSRKGL